MRLELPMQGGGRGGSRCEEGDSRWNGVGAAPKEFGVCIKADGRITRCDPASLAQASLATLA